MTDSRLYIDPQIPYPHDPNISFKESREQCKNLIAHYRLDLTQDSQKIIDANAPFELHPQTKPRYGALLIHGLLESPFHMQDIGKHLCTQGLLVRSLLLPGHGIVPGA